MKHTLLILLTSAIVLTSASAFARVVTDPDQQERLGEGATITKIMYPETATRSDIDMFKAAVISAVGADTAKECADTLNIGMQHITDGLYSMTVQADKDGRLMKFNTLVTPTRITGHCLAIN